MHISILLKCLFLSTKTCLASTLPLQNSTQSQESEMKVFKTHSSTYTQKAAKISAEKSSEYFSLRSLFK